MSRMLEFPIRTQFGGLGKSDSSKQWLPVFRPSRFRRLSIFVGNKKSGAGTGSRAQPGRGPPGVMKLRSRLSSLERASLARPWQASVGRKTRRAHGSALGLDLTAPVLSRGAEVSCLTYRSVGEAPSMGVGEPFGLASEAALQGSLVRRLSNYEGNDILRIR